MRRERSVLEVAVRTVSEQATAASVVVDKAINAGLGDSHPVTHHAKMLRLELLNLKADLERELGGLVLDCASCGRRVHLGCRTRRNTRPLGTPRARAAPRARYLMLSHT
jgi:hypothetical protein